MEAQLPSHGPRPATAPQQIPEATPVIPSESVSAPIAVAPHAQFPAEAIRFLVHFMVAEQPLIPTSSPRLTGFIRGIVSAALLAVGTFIALTMGVVLFAFWMSNETYVNTFLHPLALVGYLGIGTLIAAGTGRFRGAVPITVAGANHLVRMLENPTLFRHQSVERPDHLVLETLRESLTATRTKEVFGRTVTVRVPAAEQVQSRVEIPIALAEAITLFLEAVLAKDVQANDEVLIRALAAKHGLPVDAPVFGRIRNHIRYLGGESLGSAKQVAERLFRLLTDPAA
jgi:hypothetical protein